MFLTKFLNGHTRHSKSKRKRRIEKPYPENRFRQMTSSRTVRMLPVVTKYNTVSVNSQERGTGSTGELSSTVPTTLRKKKSEVTGTFRQKGVENPGTRSQNDDRRQERRQSGDFHLQIVRPTQKKRQIQEQDTLDWIELYCKYTTIQESKYNGRVQRRTPRS